MELKKLDEGTKFNMECPECKHTGIRTEFEVLGSLAYICKKCNGRGYISVTVTEKDEYLVDLITGTILQETDDFVFDSIEFKELAVRPGVTHVVYASNNIADAEFFIKKGYNSDHVVPYEDFLSGEKWPLPLEMDTCPARLESEYCKQHNFDNKCELGDFTMCKRFNTGECWGKYYGIGALTLKSKQDKLKSMKRQ
ncbi:MAG: hypothetical protein IKZ96_00995 [Bacilli bacterium]|nr:hypothetical protein [Bacilli bacterium]